MKIKFHRLILHAKREDYEISFSDSITYFYGKMGAGKSTIPRLIKFCLGGDLKETPALQHEFVGANLELHIGKYFVKLDRQRGQHQILAAWRELPDGEPIAMQIPIQPKEEPIIPHTKVYGISDLIFYLSGLEPPYVLKSKLTLDTDLIRLGFKDLMWYCYLDQDHIDSSFFYLEPGEDFIRRGKSQDAIRFILGFQYDEIVRLERSLAESKQDRSSKMESAEQLRNFLQENGIKSSEDILEQIRNLENEQTVTKKEIQGIRGEILVPSHPVEEFKSKRTTLNQKIHQTEEEVNDIEFQISNQYRLKSEFITANMKIDRTISAKKVFKNIKFETCPQCGHHVDEKIKDACSLCKNSIHEDSIDNLKILNPDLLERIKEVDQSIHQLTEEKNRLRYKLKSIINEKNEIDNRLVELERENDSKYLAKASEILQRKGIIEGKIQYFKHMLSLPQKVDLLEMESAELSIVIDKIKRDLETEKGKMHKEQTTLHDLEKIFLDTLKQVKFPGISNDDVVVISPETYVPHIRSNDKADSTFSSFANIGSGGKKTIFKACYAISIHRLAARISSEIPTFLIIDTPMKNISERENKDVFNSFYQFVYLMASTELKGRQIIIIDKELYKGTDKQSLKFIVRHMTPDDPRNPPLISYYRGN